MIDDDDARAVIAETRCPSGARKVHENLLRLSAIGDLPWGTLH